MGASTLSAAAPAASRPESEVAQLRVPPHSIEAESGLLGGLMFDNGAWEGASASLLEGDFYRHEHRLVYAAIGGLINAGRPADVITVFEQLQNLGHADEVGGLAYLNKLAQFVPVAGNVRRYAEIVRERATLRRLVAAADEIAAEAFNPKGRSAAELLDGAAAALNRIGEGPAASALRLHALNLDALREASGALRWLVKGIIPAEALVMLFGASGTFKSFIALDLALHVVHGLPWLGRRAPAGAQPVLYIAAEGGSGLWNRVLAWHQDRHLDWRGAPLFVVTVAVDLVAEAWRVVSAAQAVGVTPALVIVDTLSQTFAGEENSANEMAAYLRELGHRFRARWRCAVMVIHHSGHQATERPRGSSAITANVDVLLGAHRDEKEMLATLSNPKQKDGERFADATFSLRSIELGTDADGDKVTSLVARHLSTADEVARAEAAERAAGRSGRGQQFLDLVRNGEPEKELRHAFYETLGDLSPEAKKKAYYRHRDSAAARGQIEIAQGVVIDLRKGAQ